MEKWNRQRFQQNRKPVSTHTKHTGYAGLQRHWYNLIISTKKRLYKCKACAGEGIVYGEEVVEVKIPAGVAEGMQLSVNGKGNAGTPFHAGADLALMEDFIEAVRSSKKSLATAIDVSVESHLICYEAERSRREERIIVF